MKLAECLSADEGGIPADAEIAIEEVYDETWEVPGLGEVETTAVTWKISLGDESGQDTSHLIERGGEWKWILQRAH